MNCKRSTFYPWTLQCVCGQNPCALDTDKSSWECPACGADLPIAEINDPCGECGELPPEDTTTTN